MNVLVTGSSGFIGSKYFDVLLDKGFNVYRLIRSESKEGSLGSNVLVLNENSVDGFVLALTVRFDYIFNFAAYGVDRKDQNLTKMVMGNITFLSNLINSLSYKPVLIVNVGSCAEYGALEQGICVTEKHLLSPTSLYGSVKASSTLINTQLAKDKGFNLINLRLFGVFGEGEAEHRLMPYLISRLSANTSVELTTGEQQRDMLYIDDVISAFLSVFESTEKLLAHDIYNVCTGTPVKVKDFVNLVAAELQRPLSLLKWGSVIREDEPEWVVGSSDLFRPCTGWSPVYTLKTALAKAIPAYKLLHYQ